MSIRIVYMGTPEFAVAPLEALLQDGIEVVAVITVPDKPAGRGMQLQQSAVKKCALSHGIPVLQPEKLKDEQFLKELADFQADLFVVVAFRMLPEAVFAMPRLGTFNLHGSLLPQYRGAAPIHWAVINGDTETGVTTFFIDKEIDTGHIIDRATTPIGPNECTGDIHDRLMQIGAELVVKTVRRIEKGECQVLPQATLAEGVQLRSAPKLFKEHCKIDWAKPSLSIHNLIRGLSPFPAAYSILPKGERQLNVKIFQASISDRKAAEPQPGRMRVIGNALFVDTADGSIQILELQLEGKKRMPAAAFLKGYSFTQDEILI